MVARSERIPGWLPYLLPCFLFLAADWAGSRLLDRESLGVLGRTLFTGGAVLYFWRAGYYPELSLRPSLLGIAAGLVGYLVWVLPEGALAGVPKLGPASGFDPDQVAPAWRTPLLSVRLFSSVLVVPLFEELFLRSFLVRHLDALRTDHGDFRRLPIGRFSRFSFIGVVVAMAVTHHRWIRGGLYSALMLAVLHKEKRMDGVIWAHAVTNLCLGIHVLAAGSWGFW